jgi:hypothetical protein
VHKLESKRHIEKSIKFGCIIFSVAFVIAATSYYVLNYIYSIEVYYLGITSLALLFPFLLSIAYFMIVSAKRALDKGVERNEIGLKCQITETFAEKE